MGKRGRRVEAWMKTRGDDRERERERERESRRSPQFITEIKVKASTDLNDRASASLEKGRGRQDRAINRKRQRDMIIMGKKEKKRDGGT